MNHTNHLAGDGDELNAGATGAGAISHSNQRAGGSGRARKASRRRSHLGGMEAAPTTPGQRYEETWLLLTDVIS